MINKSSITKNLKRKKEKKREETLLSLMCDTHLHEKTNCRCYLL